MEELDKVLERHKEQFEAKAYAYRSWPWQDQMGVNKRFDELLEYVNALVALVRQDQRQIMYDDEDPPRDF